MIKYSAVEHACYNTLLNYKVLPTDLIVITSADYDIFRGESITEGQQLIKNAYPFVLEDIPVVEISIETIRDAKAAEIRATCESKVDAGFIASILFSDCHYRNDRDQQQTMREASERAAGGRVWMNEDFTSHTKAQAAAVYALSISEKEGYRITSADKCGYINDQSRTIDDINAVTWDSIE